MSGSADAQNAGDKEMKNEMTAGEAAEIGFDIQSKSTHYCPYCGICMVEEDDNNKYRSNVFK